MRKLINIYTHTQQWQKMIWSLGFPRKKWGRNPIKSFIMKKVIKKYKKCYKSCGEYIFRRTWIFYSSYFPLNLVIGIMYTKCFVHVCFFPLQDKAIVSWKDIICRNILLNWAPTHGQITMKPVFFLSFFLYFNFTMDKY